MNETAGPRRRTERAHLDVRREIGRGGGLRDHDELVDTRRERAQLRDRRSERRMGWIDALRQEDEPPHQKKSVSPSVTRHARGSVSSLPASAFPMKCSVRGVGTKPQDRYAASSPRAGTANSTRTPGLTPAMDARSSGRTGPTRSATSATERPRCRLCPTTAGPPAARYAT